LTLNENTEAFLSNGNLITEEDLYGYGITRHNHLNDNKERKNNSKEFIFSEVGSNNTAELCALAHALKWLIIEGSDTNAVIRGDSQYALNIGSGIWKAKANKELALHVQKLWIEVSSFRNLTHDHVRAHRGHRWNERADHLAFRAMQGREPLPVQFWKPGQR
jgi:ribonuclease HI